MLHLKLSKFKDRSGLTNQQIAEKSGVPLSTVTRVFNGQTDNPNYRTVADIVLAIGGSLDEMEGIKQPGEVVPDKMLQFYERELENKNKWIKILFLSFLGITAVLVTIVMIDVLNGGIGFIRY